MNFKEKELIIFDLDGTLINSIPDLTQAINMMLEYYNLVSLSIEEVTRFVGNGAKKLVERSLNQVLPNNQNIDKIFDEAFNVYLSSYEKVVCDKTYLYSGVKETLTYLNKKGYKMVICTNKPYRFIEPILTTLEIKSYFVEWIGEDSLSEKKPNATPLLYFSEKMNISVDKCVMIGDSKNDILAAKNAKMDSIGLSYGYNYDEDISHFEPTQVADNFAQLQDFF